MYIKNWVIILTGLALYDAYHEHIYFNKLKTYKKYYKMIAIAIAGIGIYKMLQNSSNLNKLKIFDNFIKIIPIDKSSKDMISPFLSGETNEIPKRMLSSGKHCKRSVSEVKKKVIASRQNWSCNDCKDTLTAWFEVDHVKRLDQGGTNEIDNLVALCRNCHGKKTAYENM
tara:strand:- start:291 stop:800 length:510 start_codon:yes stop_codon:yes gene_type:complete